MGSLARKKRKLHFIELSSFDIYLDCFTMDQMAEIENISKGLRASSGDKQLECFKGLLKQVIKDDEGNAPDNIDEVVDSFTMNDYTIAMAIAQGEEVKKKDGKIDVNYYLQQTVSRAKESTN